MFEAFVSREMSQPLLEVCWAGTSQTFNSLEVLCRMDLRLIWWSFSCFQGSGPTFNYRR